MNSNDSTVRSILRRSMVARIATLSRNGRPNVNPLYFIFRGGHIWLGTADWTLAARNVKADPRVSILFEVERDRSPRRMLRISGHARVRTDSEIVRAFILRSVWKYYLTPGGIFNMLAHVRLIPSMHNYHMQAAEKGHACVIEFTPEQAILFPGRGEA
jgi:general stress protein 26